MSWVFLDDRFFTNRKVMSVSMHARWLYLSALCVASQQGTDGKLPDTAQDCLMVAVGRSASFDALAGELVTAGLWIKDKRGAYEMARDRLWGIQAPRMSSARPYLRHRKAVYSRDGGRCRYCQAAENLSIDHLCPPRLGGTHALENLVTACRPCNSKKGSRTPEQAGMHLLSPGSP